MLANILRASLLTAALIAAGCTDTTLSGVSSGGAKAERPLPEKIVAKMKAKGMTRTSPVMARVFKEEGKVEVWKQKKNGRYDLIAEYDICKWSGKLGPKYTEGDRQAPEGFYTVRPAQMNPQSSYHLAFNIGFPNTYDRANGRTGANLMVHGACSSSGCYSMTDAAMEEIYAFGRDAFRGGQTEFQIQAFPFRMTAANMARYRNDPNYEFWKMLKEGYDHFEITKVPPKVDICEKRYVFNQTPVEGATFNATSACPMTTQPDSLKMAYQSYQTSYAAAFSSATGSKVVPPKPTIAGTKEAALVSEWTKKRARGERVPVEPPSLQQDGTVVVTSRMGRIDSPAGRRMAEQEATVEAKKKAAEEKLAAAQRAADQKAAAAAAAKAQREAPAVQPEPAVASETVAAPTVGAPAEEKPGLLGGMRKKIGNLFGS
ncbi:MAG: murein L,D-transpeptidase family protein [Mesorhizobium sp.]